MTTETTPEHTLADIVNNSPGSARVLESYGLDYCCGGRRSLADACAELGADPRQVIDSIDGLEKSEPG